MRSNTKLEVGDYVRVIGGTTTSAFFGKDDVGIIRHCRGACYWVEKLGDKNSQSCFYDCELVKVKNVQEKTMKDTFWMVYGVGKSAPTEKHSTTYSAEREAERLAKANPGVEFVVLESKKSCKVAHPVEWSEHGYCPF